METKTDLVAQVAEARMTIDHGNGVTENCLRWPPLSRECWCSGLADSQQIIETCNAPNHHCNAGRVPDCSLEKVFAAAVKDGVHHIDIDYEDDRIYVVFTPDGKSQDDDDLPFGLSSDLELAAIAALLAT